MRNREHENQYRKDRRAMYYMLGICPYCRKSKLKEDECMCFNCRVAYAERLQRSRERRRKEARA